MLVIQLVKKDPSLGQKVANSDYTKKKTSKQLYSEVAQLEKDRLQTIAENKEYEDKIALLEKEMRQLEDHNDNIDYVTGELSQKLAGFEQVIDDCQVKAQEEKDQEQNVKTMKKLEQKAKEQEAQMIKVQAEAKLRAEEDALMKEKQEKEEITRRRDENVAKKLKDQREMSARRKEKIK